MTRRPRRRRTPAAAAVGLAGAVALAGSVSSCGGGDETLVVFAASSLTDVFAELEEAFERERPGVDVVLNLGGSSSLAAQIEQGAPADVFAAADERTMERIVGEVDGTPSVFAGNRLAIVVAAGNPFAIASLADLERDDLVVVLAAPEVPVGAYARAAAAELGVEIDPASLEQNVRAVAAKVALGEADAGVVYRTDVRPDDDRLAIVEISGDQVATYPIVVVDDGELAREFAAFVTGPTGRAALVDAGFEIP